MKKFYGAAASGPCQALSLGLEGKQLVSVQRHLRVIPRGFELLIFCTHVCCVSNGIRCVHLMASFHDFFPSIVGHRSLLQDECAWSADRIRRKATTVS